MRKKEEEQGSELLRCGVSVLLGGVTALAVCLAFLLGVAATVSSGLVGEGLTYQFTVMGCVLGCFAGGMLAVRRCGSRTLVVGLTVGAVFFLLLLTIGALFYREISPEAGGIGLLCGALCGGAAAGLTGGWHGKGARRKKRRK